MSLIIYTCIFLFSHFVFVFFLYSACIHVHGNHLSSIFQSF
ncbi:unnamed protein product [Arabidopsis halleri]